VGAGQDQGGYAMTGEDVMGYAICIIIAAFVAYLADGLLNGWD